MSDLNTNPRAIADLSPDQGRAPEPDDFPPSTQDVNDGRRQDFVGHAKSQVTAYEQQNKIPQLRRGRDMGFFSLAAKETRNDGKASLKSEKWLAERLVGLIDRVECQGTDDSLGIVIAAVLSFPSPGSLHLKSVINRVVYTAAPAAINTLDLGDITVSPLIYLQQDEARKVEKAWNICHFLWKNQTFLLHRIAMNAATHRQLRVEDCETARSNVFYAANNGKAIRETFSLFDPLDSPEYRAGVARSEDYLSNGKYSQYNVGMADWCVADMNQLRDPDIEPTRFDELINRCLARKKQTGDKSKSPEGELASELLSALQTCIKERTHAKERAVDILHRLENVVKHDCVILDDARNAMQNKIDELNRNVSVGQLNAAQRS